NLLLESGGAGSRTVPSELHDDPPRPAWTGEQRGFGHESSAPPRLMNLCGPACSDQPRRNVENGVAMALVEARDGWVISRDVRALRRQLLAVLAALDEAG